MKNPEFKAKKLGNDTVYTLSETTAGSIGSGSIGSGSGGNVVKGVGKLQRRADSIIMQSKDSKDKPTPPTVRNPVAHAAQRVAKGSGSHDDKKFNRKVKHPNKNMDFGEDHSTVGLNGKPFGAGAYNTGSKDTSRTAGPGGDEFFREDSMSGADIPDNELDQVHPSDTGTDDEYGMEGEYVKNQLHTIIRAATHLGHALDDQENLPTWVIDKISQSKGMLVAVFDYMISEKELDIGQDTTADEHPTISENDQYISELYAKLSEKIAKNAPVKTYIDDFEKAAKTPNAKGHHQFKNKSPEKVRQMAIAASYGAKNPSKKKK